MRRTLLRATGPLALVFALFACSEAPLGPSLDAEGAQYSTAVAAPQVVISQVYGGGGNSGATLRNDFIELFNPGTAPVSLAGWSVQYASSTGSTWQVTALSGTIQPGAYYLVQQAAGTGGTVSLPTPDATGSIPMSGTAGKVALSQTTAALSGTCPAGVVDLVSFGTAATNCARRHHPHPQQHDRGAPQRPGVRVHREPGGRLQHRHAESAQRRQPHVHLPHRRPAPAGLGDHRAGE